VSSPGRRARDRRGPRGRAGRGRGPEIKAPRSSPSQPGARGGARRPARSPRCLPGVSSLAGEHRADRPRGSCSGVERTEVEPEEPRRRRRGPSSVTGSSVTASSVRRRPARGVRWSVGLGVSRTGSGRHGGALVACLGSGTGPAGDLAGDGPVTWPSSVEARARGCRARSRGARPVPRSRAGGRGRARGAEPEGVEPEASRSRARGCRARSGGARPEEASGRRRARKAPPAPAGTGTDRREATGGRRAGAGGRRGDHAGEQGGGGAGDPEPRRRPSSRRERPSRGPRRRPAGDPEASRQPGRDRRGDRRGRPAVGGSPGGGLAPGSGRVLVVGTGLLGLVCVYT